MAFKAKTFNNYLSNSDCNTLVNFVSTSNLWEQSTNEFWSNRVIRPQTTPENIKQILRPIIHNIKYTLEKEYSLDNEIYPDTFDLIRWFDGMNQPAHCDDMTGTDAFKYCGHRYFGCIIYLNDNYEGGYTFYPEQNFEVKPEVGKLAIHLGDCEHKHGVTQIKGNTRYTIASFWTFDKEKSMLNNF
jgi:hypothetical protein